MGDPNDGQADWSGPLLELLRCEQRSIPRGAWGAFFPVTIALWRLINLKTGGRLGEVHAVWTDAHAAVPSEIEVRGETYVIRQGPPALVSKEGRGFLGAGGIWLLGQEQGGLLHALMQVSYALVAAAPRGQPPVDGDEPGRPASIDNALLSRLATLAREAVSKAGLDSVTKPKAT